YPLDCHLRGRVSARRLELNPAQAEPPLDDVAGEVDILNPRLGEAHLSAEENPPPHPDPLAVDIVAERDIAEVARNENEEERGAKKQGRQDVVHQQIPVRNQLDRKRREEPRAMTLDRLRAAVGGG